MKNKQKRRLITIGRKWVKSTPKHEARPFLPLVGRWLQKAGFSIGDIIEIDVQDGCLVIRKTANSWRIHRKVQVEYEKCMVNEVGERINKSTIRIQADEN